MDETKDVEVKQKLTSEEQYILYIDQLSNDVLNTTYLLNKSLKTKINVFKVLNDLADRITKNVEEINLASKMNE